MADRPEDRGDPPRAELPSVSVVIATYGRREALLRTVAALFRVDYPPERVELVVVDDGSEDGTGDAAEALAGEAPFPLRVIRQENRGVSAARNAGAAAAAGELLVFLSDDLVVPADFLLEHVRAHRAVPGAWVVGGFEQLPETRSTPFGRYVDDLEERFQGSRLGSPVAPGIRRCLITARNLSLPRRDFEAADGFDTRFRTTCEDQDLVHRVEARGATVEVVYNERISALHNEQATTLERYGRFQRRGARDTVRLLARYPEIHGRAPVARVNGPVDLAADGVAGAAVKGLKALLSRPLALRAVTASAAGLQRLPLPERWLHRYYEAALSLYVFRGWREGLETLEDEEGAP